LHDYEIRVMAIVCIDDQARAVEIRDRVIIRLPDNPSGGKKKCK